ncbi:septum site-determining protein MinC [Caloramator fervidus]|uniref:Probable septum site-determining protein MinC n=1 Tax=Caloramator fervidus TaxID=29344 RepID=A0A1H5VRV2_9CLOT|nr:septum site-determining protein MinC [Caloramator fervidus]SEF89746.1 septum site-determining protein MinC [Caloramator fervidus]
MGSVVFKGNRNGIVIYVLGKEPDEIKQDIFNKLSQGKDFFYGCNMYIKSDFEFPEEFLLDLKEELKKQFNANLILEEKKVNSNKRLIDLNEGMTKILKKTIRSGQRIYYDGNIVIVGDVNSGAEVIATGNIIVLGVVRGILHAGANGNTKAFIAAYDLQPEQIRIADIISRSPDDKSDKPKIPEVAKIKGKYISIEPYLPNKLL